MELRLDSPGEYFAVRAVSARGIQINEEWYQGSLILSTREVIAPWNVERLEDLGKADVERILALKPEVVLIGTGDRQRLLPPELLVRFLEHGAGAEAMTTPAACRTFNVLASERRRVVAALINRSG